MELTTEESFKTNIQTLEALLFSIFPNHGPIDIEVSIDGKDRIAKMYIAGESFIRTGSFTSDEAARIALIESAIEFLNEIVLKKNELASYYKGTSFESTLDKVLEDFKLLSTPPSASKDSSITFGSLKEKTSERPFTSMIIRILSFARLKRTINNPSLN